MAGQSVVAVYNSISDADSALRTLDEGGSAVRQVSIVAKNYSQRDEISRLSSGFRALAH